MPLKSNRTILAIQKELKMIHQAHNLLSPDRPAMFKAGYVFSNLMKTIGILNDLDKLQLKNLTRNDNQFLQELVASIMKTLLLQLKYIYDNPRIVQADSELADFCSATPNSGLIQLITKMANYTKLVDLEFDVKRIQAQQHKPIASPRQKSAFTQIEDEKSHPKLVAALHPIKEVYDTQQRFHQAMREFSDSLERYVLPAAIKINLPQEEILQLKYFLNLVKQLKENPFSLTPGTVPNSVSRAVQTLDQQMSSDKFHATFAIIAKYNEGYQNLEKILSKLQNSTEFKKAADEIATANKQKFNFGEQIIRCQNKPIQLLANRNVTLAEIGKKIKDSQPDDLDVKDYPPDIKSLLSYVGLDIAGVMKEKTSAVNAKLQDTYTNTHEYLLNIVMFELKRMFAEIKPKNQNLAANILSVLDELDPNKRSALGLAPPSFSEIQEQLCKLFKSDNFSKQPNFKNRLNNLISSCDNAQLKLDSSPESVARCLIHRLATIESQFSHQPRHQTALHNAQNKLAKQPITYKDIDKTVNNLLPSFALPSTAFERHYRKPTRYDPNFLIAITPYVELLKSEKNRKIETQKKSASPSRRA